MLYEVRRFVFMLKIKGVIFSRVACNVSFILSSSPVKYENNPGDRGIFLSDTLLYSGF